MNIQLTAFKWVPPFAQGLVKDLRVRNVCGDFGPEFNAVLDPCMANAM